MNRSVPNTLDSSHVGAGHVRENAFEFQRDLQAFQQQYRRNRLDSGDLLQREFYHQRSQKMVQSNINYV